MIANYTHLFCKENVRESPEFAVFHTIENGVKEMTRERNTPPFSKNYC
jgi:hypothetical protein